MANILFICFVSAFFVLGVCAFVSDAARVFHRRIPLNITVHTRDMRGAPEYFIRSLFALYPDARLVVVDDGGSPETSAELECLARQFPSVVVTAADSSVRINCCLQHHKTL